MVFTHDKPFTPVCPIPISEYPHVMMAHGGGGKLMHNLIEKMFISTFDNDHLRAGHDSAIIEPHAFRLAFTTDSYVVNPIFFPGGDIGSMAVYGTVNDLAMSGARPLYLSVGLILEEGFPMEELWRVIQSLKYAADSANVQLITGDTKVVDRGKGDGIYINTAGIGIIEHHLNIAPQSVQIGDAVIISGDIGRHGISIIATREGLAFESEIESDSAPLSNRIMSLLDTGIEVHCMRDLTRGGLASALIEIALKTKTNIHVDERSIPVRDDVRGACEMLGFDPLYVANEGRFVAFVPLEEAERAIRTLNQDQGDSHAALIGHVTAQHPGVVTIKSAIGATRIVDMLSGEQLPRIC